MPRKKKMALPDIRLTLTKRDDDALEDAHFLGEREEFLSGFIVKGATAKQIRNCLELHGFKCEDEEPI